MENMSFSQTALELLEQVASGNDNIVGIGKALKKSRSQIYRSSKTISELIEINRCRLIPKKTPMTSLLLNLLSKNPNIKNLLIKEKIGVLCSILEPKTVRQVEKETG